MSVRALRLGVGLTASLMAVASMASGGNDASLDGVKVHRVGHAIEISAPLEVVPELLDVTRTLLEHEQRRHIIAHIRAMG